MIFITIAVVFAVLAGSEFWWRKHGLHGEFSRKFIHITVGSFVAFWPYFLSATEIKLLSVAFLLTVAASRYLNILQAIHSVQRPTWGEFWFAVTVGVLAFTLGHPHIYTAALLVMSLADGLAAVVGTHYGNRQRYSVLGSPKTVIGTLTFFVVSCAILAGYDMLTPHTAVTLFIVPLSLGATALENFGVRGLDNLLVPLLVAITLHALA